MSSSYKPEIKFLYICIVVLVVIPVVVYISEVYPIQFSQDRWLRANAETRGRMLPSLLQITWINVIGYESQEQEVPECFFGMTEKEVRAFLGPPDRYSEISTSEYSISGKKKKLRYKVGSLGEIEFPAYDHTLVIVFSGVSDESMVLAVKVTD